MVDPMEKISDKPNIFYNKGTTYSVTINPDDKHQYAGKHDRLQKFRSFIYEQLISLSEYGIRYFFVIELSEPREVKQGALGPRLHLHGLIRFASKKAVKYFLLHVLHKWSRFGYTNIDTCKNKDVWIDYIMKQQDIIDTLPITSMDIDSWRSTMFPITSTNGT